MKNFRTIISKTLIDELGIDAMMLSRLDGDKPICIELHDSAEIYITAEDNDFLMVFIEVPIKDKRKLQMQSSKIINSLIEDEELMMNIKKDKVILLCHIDKKSQSIENKLLDKLVSFNKFSDIINN